MNLARSNIAYSKLDTYPTFYSGLIFRPVPTLWVAILESILMLLFGVLIFYNPFGVVIQDNPLALRALAHSFIFVVTLLITIYTNYHHDEARADGHLMFYKKVTPLSRAAPITWSIGNALLIVVFAVWPPDKPKEGILAELNVVRLLSFLELVIVLPCLAIYMYMVYTHNREKPIPEAHIREYQMPTIQNDPDSGGDGYKGELVEKQAEVIRYLKEQKELLSKQILELRDAEHSNDSTQHSLNDAKHLLSAKDQEIRLLAAERDMLLEGQKKSGDF